MSVIHRISLGMVNAYLIKGEKTVLVDTGLASHYDKLLKKIRKYSVEPEDLSLIIISHSHADHFGSAQRLNDAYNIPIAIHSSSYKEGKEVEASHAIPNVLIAKIIDKVTPKTKQDTFVADIGLEDQQTLEAYGIDAKVLHLPGHTEDSIGIVIGHEIIVADMLNSSKRKGVSEPLFLNDRDTFLVSLRKLIGLKPKKLYCSHSKEIEGTQLNKLSNLL